MIYILLLIFPFLLLFLLHYNSSSSSVLFCNQSVFVQQLFPFVTWSVSFVFMAVNRRNPRNKAKDATPTVDDLGALTDTTEATTTGAMGKKRKTRPSDNLSPPPSKRNAPLVSTSPMETARRPSFSQL